MIKTLISILLAIGGILLFLLWSSGNADTSKEQIVEKQASPLEAHKKCLVLEKDWEQHSCWQDLLEETLQKSGLGAAFELIALLYEVWPDCHVYAHQIGEEAYRLFAAGKEITLTSNTSYCGYGFYHGFIETLLHSTGDLKKAKEFCAYVDEELSKQRWGGSGACYHGIGHGVVDGSDPALWGNAETMIQPALQMCEAVAETETQRHLCATGVFNAIDILSQYPEYKLSHIRKDPYKLCHRQSHQYKKACYTNMVPPLFSTVAQRDFLRAARLIEDTIPDDEDYSLRSEAILTLFHLYFRAHEGKNQTQGVLLCRSLQDRSHLPCIRGLAWGYIQYGEPGEEYKRGLAFCESSILGEEEKEVCFQQILSNLRGWYSKELTQQICTAVDEKYRKFCQKK